MTTKKTLILAMTLLTAGALATSCSSEDSITDGSLAQQPAAGEITLTATLAPKGNDGSGTRAITTGTGTGGKEILNVAWAKNEQIAICYEKTDGTKAKVGARVTAVNATTGAATIEATLTNAKGGTATFIYPYSLATKDGELDTSLDSEFRTQDGTIAYISEFLDAATAYGTIDVTGTTATVSGTISLANQVCICKFSFSGLSTDTDENYYDITIREKDGTKTKNTYVAPNIAKASMGAVYMALLGAKTKTFTFSVQGKSSASAVSSEQPNSYETSMTSVTLVAGKFYRSIPVAVGLKKMFSTVFVPDGGILTLDDATISVVSGPAIQCEGNATIVLTGSNSATTSANDLPAISVPAGKTLIIQGTGSLTAESTGNNGAGIGGGKNYVCGDIIINGGTITATGGSGAAGIGSGNGGTCGNITINDGTITATGGSGAAGIGSGYGGTCDDITIGRELTSLTVTAGHSAEAPIGSGHDGFCGTVKISGYTDWSVYYITEGYDMAGYWWVVSTVKDSNGYDITRWTLTSYIA